MTTTNAPDLGALTLEGLHNHHQHCLAKIAEWQAQAAAVATEIATRLAPATDAAIKAADKLHGTFNVPVGGGFIAKVDIGKTVKYDTSKLMAVAQTMTWERAQQLFKIEFSVAEKVYDGLKIAAPELVAKIDEARTVSYGKPKLTLTREETAVA